MKKIVALSLIIFITVAGFSQSEKSLLKIGNKNISSEEFLRLYKKNNSNNLNDQTIDEYLDLFIKFKLKVTEAENLKMDTAKAFRDEFNGYKDQLAKPYLSEKLKYEQLIEEAYKRNQNELKLDIIFVKVSMNAAPEDTLKAYNKALKIKQRLLNGEDFETLALQTSDDRGVEKNKGHLSFLKPARIPYNIQNYAFSENATQFSDPIKTDYGYYIIRLVETRPDQGFVKVAHIMQAVNDQMSEDEKNAKKNKIDSIYDRLLKGEKFEDLAQISDDKATVKKGGELPQFSTGKMVPEFEAAAFNIQNPGEYTTPIKTTFGWHIIKLIEKLPPLSPDEQKEEIRKVVETDNDRKLIVKEFVIQNLKNKFKFKIENKPSNVLQIIDSSIYKAKWKLPENFNSTVTLFSISDQKYSENEFAKFLTENQKGLKGKSFNEIVDAGLNDFIYKSLTDKEKKELEKINPDYRYLMQEYHDGMLLFELMKKEVWDKATDDTVGLKKYYEDNKNIYNNQTEFDISVFEYKDENALKSAEDLLLNKRDLYPDTLLVTKICENNKDAFRLIENGAYTKGQNIYADIIFKMDENTELAANQKIIIRKTEKILIFINNKRISKSKEFDEIKGVVIADYQNYLEEKWMEKLKSKYPIKINKKELKKLKAECNQ